MYYLYVYIGGTLVAAFLLEWFIYHSDGDCTRGDIISAAFLSFIWPVLILIAIMIKISDIIDGPREAIKKWLNTPVRRK